MDINSRGKATDGRGREVLVVEANLPGKYPVLGVQLRNSGEGVSKGGIRRYTREGKYYANSGSTNDALDLESFEAVDDVLAPTEAEPEMVSLSNSAGGTALVERGSDEHETLMDLGWSEDE